MFFNTHSHVDTGRQFAEDRAEVVQRALDMGVSRLMVVGFHKAAIPVSVAFAHQHDWAYAAVGIHPTEAAEWDAETEALVRQACADPKVVAIGEIGLDYYWKDRAPFDLQREVFRQQIRLAREVALPISIHDRDAHEDTLRILEEEHAEDVGGIMHCFAGDWAMAERCMALGFVLGIGGTVTYKNNKVVQEVARRAPLDHLVLETDDPYLAPVPMRGRRNEPGYVRYVAEFLAQLRGISVEEVAEATYRNAFRVLRLTEAE